MPKMNGFELLRQLETIDFEIIFTTAYKKYAIEAIKFSVLDYLSKPIDLEELELELIDFGVEEIFEDTDEDEEVNEVTSVMIYAPFESFGKIQSYLEENNIEILSSGFERIPQVMNKLTPEQMEDVEKLLEKIEEDDDVQNVYHNMEETT